MPQFKLIVKIQRVNGEEHYYAHLDAWRSNHYAVIGVFVLHPAEWAAFYEICANENIEIEYEQPDAVPA